MSEFKIGKVGFYVTRDGRKVEIEYISKYGVHCCCGGFVGGSHAYTWLTSGAFDVDSGSGDMDIVGPWVEPEPLYEWAFLIDITNRWVIDSTLMTEEHAENYREYMKFLDKHRLRSFNLSEESTHE